LEDKSCQFLRHSSKIFGIASLMQAAQCEWLVLVVVIDDGDDGVTVGV
jgi:hypothetical protein